MKYRHWVLFSILFSITLEASERFKGVDLWLPTTYQKQYSTLLDAAEKAKNDPYCFQLLSGRVLEEQSTLDNLQFNFRCRTEDRKTFSIQVDGNSLAMTNTYGDQQRKIEAEPLAEALRAKTVKTKEEAEAERIEEEARLLAELEAAAQLAEDVAARHREQSQYWTICRKIMRKKLRTFDEVTILTESLPEPTVQADQFTYTVLFDAINPSKKPLHFQIICTISALDYYNVDIKPRKKISDKK